MRIDKLLVERGLVKTRERARALIMAGDVLVEDAPVTKAGTGVDDGAHIRLRRPTHRFRDLSGSSRFTRASSGHPPRLGPNQGFPRIFLDSRWISMDSRGFSKDFLGSSWISMDFQGFSRISHGFPRIFMDFPWISMGFLGLPLDFLGFPWISIGFHGFLHGFP